MELNRKASAVNGDKYLIYISSLQNVIEINKLEPKTIKDFYHVPKVLLMLGVSDIFNVIHRVSQKMVIDGVNSKDLQHKVLVILNEITKKVIEVATNSEYDKLEFSLNDFDSDFLKDIGIKY